MRDNPGKAMSAGITAALAGAGIALTVAPVIIATGSVITAAGQTLVMFGVAVAGLGIIFGVMERSSQEVMMNLLKSGLLITGLGGATMLAGTLLTGLGYVTMLGGGILALAGLGVAGYAMNELLAESPEDAAIREGFDTIIHNINEKEEIGDLPLIVADMGDDNLK